MTKDKNAEIESDRHFELSIIVPVYNEGESIEIVANSIIDAVEATDILSYEIIFVDDGSSDSTPEILHRISDEFDYVKVLTHDRNLGLGMANASGFTSARGDWLTWLPGDGQIAAKDVINLYIKHREKADLIMANIQAQERKEVDNAVRLLLSKGLRFIIYLLLNIKSEITGVFTFKRELFNNFKYRASTGTYNLILASKLLSESQGAVFENIHVLPRVAGCSKVANLRTILKTLLEVIMYRLRSTHARTR